jgi:prevent-host-death family protein
MPAFWQLQEAKNKLSEVINHAIQEGPQEITRHGKRAVVVLSVDDYQSLQHQTTSLVDFFRTSPLKGLDLERKRDIPREIEL